MPWPFSERRPPNDTPPVPGAATVLVGDTSDLTPAQSEQQKREQEDQAIIDEAIRRFHLTEEAESVMRREMRLDKAFIGGEHWPDGIKKEREDDGRPCLTINKIPQYINQITNALRESRPSVLIGPVDDKSDIETAKIFQGIIRHIETDSHADYAYDWACQEQVGIGRGWWMVTAEYAAEDSEDARLFLQDLKLKRVRDSLRIYPDPSCQEPDYSDGRFLLDVVDMPRDEFESRYGEEGKRSLSAFETSGRSQPGWISRETVRVARYWRVVTDRKRVYLDAQGQAVPEENLAEHLGLTPEITPEQVMQAGLLKTARTVEKRRVEWFILTGAAILDRGLWKGKYIPYIPVIGLESDDGGKVDLRGMVRDARDPMRRFDVQVSAETEAIGLAPKSPFVGYKGQFTDPKWAMANRRNFPYLESDLLDVNGERVPPPQRQYAEPPVRAIAESIRQADSDLRAVTGYYDQYPNEAVGSERSGRAILARQRQAEVGNSHFQDNLAKSINFTGRVLLDLIPYYYDTFRIMRIMGDDDKPRTVGVYAGAQNEPPANQPVPEGVEKIKDLSAGRYDVTVKMGKSHQSSREEKADALAALAQAVPGLVPQFADVWIGSYDWDGAQEIAQRLRPPSAQMQDESGQPVPAKFQQQMQMIMQQHEALTKVVNEQREIIDGKRLEMETRERIAKMQTEAQLLIAFAQTNTQSALAELKARIDILSASLDRDAARETAQIEAQAQGGPAPPTSAQPSMGAAGAPSGPPIASAQPPVGAAGVPLGA